jgi:peptidoglycan hydrolase-like protein with peptidoglycan-binding domain
MSTILWPNGLKTKPYVTSSFGPRKQPVAGASTNHKGTDMVGFATIRAIADGVVKVVGTPKGWSGGGVQVWVQHDGFFTRSLHMSATLVKTGQKVKAGDALGIMGRTGTATDTHLHFELTLGTLHYNNTGQINSVPWITARLGGTSAGNTTKAAIRGIQTALNTLGHGLKVDGIAGPATVAAIRAFQKSQGLVADGAWGPLTNGAYNRIVVSRRATLKQGSKGALVKLLQKKLGLTQDGVFGPKTRAAVIAFQKRQKLVADGIVGTKTWQKLGY